MIVLNGLSQGGELEKTVEIPFLMLGRVRRIFWGRAKKHIFTPKWGRSNMGQGIFPRSKTLTNILPDPYHDHT